MPDTAVAPSSTQEIAESQVIERHETQLQRGELIHAIIEQRGTDAKLRLVHGSSDWTLIIDSPNGRWGAEELIHVATASGTYYLDIELPADSEGGWEMLQLDKRWPTAEDRLHARADELLRLGRATLREGRKEDARRHLESSLELWRSLRLPAGQTETLRELGTVLQAMGELEAALRVWQQALDWYRASGDHRCSFLLHDLGRLLLRLGAPRAASHHLEEALKLFEEQASERGLDGTLPALAAAYRQQGLLQRAVDVYGRAQERLQRRRDPKGEAALLIDLAYLEMDLERHDDTRQALGRALELYRASGDPLGISRAYRGFADAAIRRGDFDRAEEEARRALYELPAEASPRRRVAPWTVIGNARRNRRDWSGAITAYSRALALLGDASQRARGTILTGLAHSHLGAGQAARALELHDEAFSIFETVGGDGDMAMSLARSAEAMLSLGQPQEAWHRAERALERVERIRTATRRQDHRRAYYGTRQEYFSIAIETLLCLHGEGSDPLAAQRALEVHDRRLAREWLEAQAHLGEVEPEPGLTARQRRLEVALASAVQTADEATAIHMLDELHRLRAESRSALPPAVSIKISKIQQELDNASLVLVYLFDGSRRTLFALTHEHLELHELPTSTTLDAELHELAVCLAKAHHRCQERIDKLAESLGSTLLTPVAGRLTDHSRLVVVADGPLLQIPFAVLAHPSKTDRALIETHEVVHLPSLSALPLLRSKARNQSKAAQVAVFADPVLATDDPRLPAGVRGTPVASQPPSEVEQRAPTATRELRRLPATRHEAEAVLRRLSSDQASRVFLGFDADRRHLLQGDWRDFTILHFATHALANRRAELAGVVLSTFDATGRRRPGFVTGIEISSLNLPVNLVVLSACETAVGQEERGEAAVGLAWSFFLAGARSVIASLWPVDDRRTSELMESFYDFHLTRGLAPAAALRQAQLQLARSPDSRRLDWAGFVFIGDWQSDR